MSTLAPNSLDELTEAVRAHAKLLPRGAGTKSALCSHPKYTPLDMRGLSGIVEYLPQEYTITMRAGTSLTEVKEALAEHGQYLPFDPPLGAAGATIGGTVAAGLSGPGRIRYGGVRDFILGVTLVTGTGQVVHGGGKVVKNAAGFDLPKFFVGSQGRFGVLAEMTFKVFPHAPAYHTWEAPPSALGKLLRGTQPCDAIEYDPTAELLHIRTGSHEPRPPIASATPGNRDIWKELANFEWADTNLLIKVPITPKDISRISDLPGIHWIGQGGQVLWVSGCDHNTLHKALTGLGLQGLALWNSTGPCWLGKINTSPYEQRLKHLFDPEARFPS